MTARVSMMTAQDTEDDAQLLVKIAQRGTAARPEIQTFYARHVRYLHAVVRKQCLSLGVTMAEAEDLVHDTFQRAFDRAATFRASAADTEAERQRWTRAWLGKIARNLLLELLRARPETLTGDMDSECERTRDSEPPSHHLRKLHAIGEAIASLSEREQDVLRVTAMYYRASAHQRLPNEVSEELAARWHTTNENIRAIRSRALKRVAELTKHLISEGS
jgi:RNA polymerase sigma factor (sigma-70 family)